MEGISGLKLPDKPNEIVSYESMPLSSARDLELLLSAREMQKKAKKKEEKRPPSPECRVHINTVEDMEVFTSDMTVLPDQGDVEKKNEVSSEVIKE